MGVDPSARPRPSRRQFTTRSPLMHTALGAGHHPVGVAMTAVVMSMVAAASL